MEVAETTVNQEDYKALHSGAALQVRPGYGVLQLTDADRIDFVQRMTTNDVAALDQGQSAVTVLTSPVARIVHLFTVLHRGDTLWLLAAGADAETLDRYLRSQIFFMDKVKVQNLSGAMQRMRLMGPEAASVLASAGLPTPAAERFQEQDDVLVLHQEAFDVPGYELVAPGEQLDLLRRQLLAAGAQLVDDDNAYKVRRVELGRPAMNHELTDQYTPLETGLAWTCAEHKGCYTGQEIIARQITYDKITKTLVGLRSDELLPEGADVHAERRTVGTITSSVYSPSAQAPIALAVVKRPHNEPGSALTVGDAAVTTSALPFVETSVR